MNERALVQNAADPQQVKAAKQKERFKKQSEINDLLWILSDIRGRRFIWRMLEGAYENPFVAGMTDVTAFNAGQKVKATTLLKEIMDARPEAYIMMMKETTNGDNPQGDENDD